MPCPAMPSRTKPCHAWPGLAPLAYLVSPGRPPQGTGVGPPFRSLASPCHAQRSLAWPRHPQPGRALPHLVPPRPAGPSLAIPCPARLAYLIGPGRPPQGTGAKPRFRSLALPCLARPGRAMPHPAMPSPPAPCRAGPSHQPWTATPGHRGRSPGFDSLPCPAPPSPTTRCRAMPNHADPNHTMPSLALLAYLISPGRPPPGDQGLALVSIPCLARPCRAEPGRGLPGLTRPRVAMPGHA